MNNKIVISLLSTIAFTLCSLTALARPEYVAPTGATGCTDCHYNNTAAVVIKPASLQPSIRHQAA